MAKETKFEDKMNRLNKIVESLEDENTDIDTALKLYEEGLNLAKELKEQLNVYDEKIKNISEGK